MAEIVRKKCEHGHFYDAAQFTSCPHCISGELEKKEDQTRSVAKYAQDYVRKMQYGQDPVTEARSEKRRNSQRDSGRETEKRQSEMPEDVDEKTIGFSTDRRRDYFVTGWMVCVEGTERGRVFNLYYGYNSIGKYCSVIYEDRKNRFYVMPDEHRVTLHNECEIEKITELHTGDSIRVGECKMEFIAFCKDDRRWERSELRRR